MAVEASEQLRQARAWVLDTITVGTPWQPTDWTARYGAWEPLPTTMRNPRVIHNYYFAAIDLTVCVNVHRGRVAAWFFGKRGL